MKIDKTLWIHLDIMDGHFVKNLTIGPPIVECVRKGTNSFFDCHLMVDNPKEYIEPFRKAGADMFTFHIEAVSSTEEIETIIQQVKSSGMLCGIAIKPNTRVELLWGFFFFCFVFLYYIFFFFLESRDFPLMIDLVNIMTVEPGFGGQEFMNEMMQKVIYIFS
jgi:ribulose-phosphate 3-epimerase